MSLTLTEFYQIMNLLASYMSAGFNALNTAYIIQDDAVTISLFELAFGFVVLEFLIYIINRFRGSPMDFSSDQSTGKQPRQVKIGDIQRSANRRNR